MNIYKQLITAIHYYRIKNKRNPDEIRINNETLDSLVSELKALAYVELEGPKEDYWFCGIKLIPDDRAKEIELIAKERFEVFPDRL